jgi:hypothetical protein
MVLAKGRNKEVEGTIAGWKRPSGEGAGPAASD